MLVHLVFRYYNLLTLIAALTFLIGFGFRLSPLLRHSYGRVILSFSNVLWYMKVDFFFRNSFIIFSAHHYHLNVARVSNYQILH